MHSDDVDLPVINVTDFRTSKLAVGSLKDLADVEALDRGRDEK